MALRHFNDDRCCDPPGPHWYYNTDTGQLYYWNREAWIEQVAPRIGTPEFIDRQLAMGRWKEIPRAGADRPETTGEDAW